MDNLYLTQWSEEFATIWIGPVPLTGSFTVQQVQRVTTDEHMHITIKLSFILLLLLYTHYVDVL